MTDNTEVQEKLAKIDARKQAFLKSPFWFTVWDFGSTLMRIACWLSFWLILAQCHCDCIWHKP